MALLSSEEKARKNGLGFPPFRRRDLSDRANPPDFRAGLGERARKSGCAVLGMTATLMAETRRSAKPNEISSSWMIQIARVCANFAFLNLSAANTTGSQLNSTLRAVLPRFYFPDAD
jgi:hypothetical protein